MHNFSYIGNQQYRCQNCGEEADKGNVTAKLAEDCPGAALPARISQQVERIEAEQVKTRADVFSLEERLDSVELLKTGVN